jgi:hypothetical protein
LRLSTKNVRLTYRRRWSLHHAPVAIPSGPHNLLTTFQVFDFITSTLRRSGMASRGLNGVWRCGTCSVTSISRSVAAQRAFTVSANCQKRGTHAKILDNDASTNSFQVLYQNLLRLRHLNSITFSPPSARKSFFQPIFQNNIARLSIQKNAAGP